ncbi:MAG: YfiR family protein [Massilia sp.]|nr:YfiR family protein [Massilia sp.]
MNALRDRLWRPACWLLLALCLCQGPALAQSNATERQVKAAYLYKFAGFVEWPDGAFARPDSPLLIGIAGNDALAEQAEQIIAGRSINGHPLAVRRVRRGDALEGVHILFVGAMDRPGMGELLATARAQSVLTVSDVDEATELGCMVHFVVADDRLRFEVALKNVTPTRLRISARMLAAAYRVQGATS